MVRKIKARRKLRKITFAVIGERHSMSGFSRAMKMTFAGKLKDIILSHLCGLSA